MMKTRRIDIRRLENEEMGLGELYRAVTHGYRIV